MSVKWVEVVERSLPPSPALLRIMNVRKRTPRQKKRGWAEKHTEKPVRKTDDEKRQTAILEPFKSYVQDCSCATNNTHQNKGVNQSYQFRQTSTKVITPRRTDFTWLLFDNKPMWEQMWNKDLYIPHPSWPSSNPEVHTQSW